MNNICRLYSKFGTVDESLTNENRGRLETVLDSEVLRAIVEKTNPANTVRD